jgi:hypothetical protein
LAANHQAIAMADEDGFDFGEVFGLHGRGEEHGMKGNGCHV